MCIIEKVTAIGRVTAIGYRPAIGCNIHTTFVVIDGPGDILLSKTSAELFGAIHFDTTLHTNSVTNEDQDFRLSLQQHFPAVFEGVGKLRGHQAMIHIDPTVTPVAQRPRRVPFALRPKVRDHLKDLMEKDIIEKVDGPSPWVSPVVVTPKPNGDIRLCVDMRRANEAIIRERHPIPTIDEVLEQLNGSTVFSKIDLRWGFHQVELSEDSRSITTFALDENLYRYKRMMFGITSAPEQYQNIIAQVTKGCEGALNIADDLIVYGRNQTEHDDNLFRVLRRLEEKGLTVGLPKCSFRQPQIEFFGLRLSDRGVEPTTSKVKAITDAPRPSNASEIRSFLGTVGFSSRFRPVRKGGSGGSDEPPRSRRRSAFFFFFFFLFGWQNLERALVCVRKTAAIFPTKWVEFENPQPTNVCFDWDMCGDRRASNERSPTLHCEATCVRRNLLVFVHSRGPFLCRRKCPW